MRFPTVILEGTKLPRIIFSFQTATSSSDRGIYHLMEKAYELGAWCFDLPSAIQLEAFKELRNATGDRALTGLCHLEAETGVSFLGKPLHRFEPKIISTIRKDLPSHLLQNIRSSPSSEVFTQKEIDRITLDPFRFDKTLSVFDPKDCPFVFFGEKYGDWLLALGRIDLLHEMVSKVRARGFIPVYSGQWTTFALPKAKPLKVAAYAFPINKKRNLFDLQHANDQIKRFDKPVISLNPLADGKLLNESEGAFSFLFDELKIYAAVVKIASEEEAGRIIEVVKNIPSLIPPRKT